MSDPLLITFINKLLLLFFETLEDKNKTDYSNIPGLSVLYSLCLPDSGLFTAFRRAHG